VQKTKHLIMKPKNTKQFRLFTAFANLGEVMLNEQLHEFTYQLKKQGLKIVRIKKNKKAKADATKTN